MHNNINDILRQNNDVEVELKAKTESKSVADATVEDFLDLKPALKLKNFIRAHKFDGHIFQETKLIG